MSRVRGAAIAVAAVLAVAACGSGGNGGGGGGGGGGGVDPEASLVDRLTVTSADERTAHGLAQGRYRLNWDAECRPTISITPADGGEPVYSTSPSLRFVLVNSLDAGVYFVDLEGDDCGDWEITLAAL